ncbi:alpha/beta hydrolase [Mucilaginibacter sp.]|uniref:alpha/beta hydrolase n=1 Tax=Mucilaginibacter sp. TaxID=1882438 RepID=UPI00262175A5|nr:alpha/beta hydrolase [Mucilaginibacter sp.]MDB5130250.1 alpha/beta hydrolase [Mucilaginibacter sp.]
MGTIKLSLLILLLLVSLLTIFKAPAYYLWLAAIVVSEFPLIFICLTGLLLITGFWIQKYQLASVITGVLAIALFISPIIRAYLISITLKQNFDSVFESKDKTQDKAFSFLKLFSSSNKTNVRYQSLAYSNDLKLDFYPSQLTEKRPCVIVVHGGSWSSGDSKQLPELNSYLATKGYNVASINYRLAPKYQAPLALEDVKQAFAYLRKNAEKLNIDTNNFILLGRSAGAQIALLAAYTQHEKGLKGVIDFYGPADMIWGYSAPASKLVMDSRGVMERYLGGTYKAVPDKYAASSPIEFVNKQTLPTLIIHGDNDVLVSPIHSRKLDEKLRQNDIKHFYLDVPWATHGFDYNINGPGGQLSTYVVERFLNAVCR